VNVPIDSGVWTIQECTSIAGARPEKKPCELDIVALASDARGLAMVEDIDAVAILVGPLCKDDMLASPAFGKGMAPLGWVKGS
jgi:hypothetical protein